MNEQVEPFRSKAFECLAGAHSELANGRYNNAANRAYYAAYNAAIVALIAAGRTSRTWGHAEVQAAFARELTIRRKIYSSAHRRVLPELLTLRLRADYGRGDLSGRDASRAVRDAQQFVRIVLGNRP